ncbi:hypothetical protein ISS08_00960 [Candidatus Pacearchaeota archaeon]|nr:hypothetical protein [Candidatus Pacearchaeota archaeon]
MSVSFSMRYIIVAFLSIVVIILGLTIVMKTTEVAEILNEIPAPANPNKISLQIEPSSSQEGTHFFIKAKLSEEREQQDIDLLIKTEGYSSNIKLFDDGNHFDEEEKDGIYGGFFDSTDKPLGKYEISKQEKNLSNFLVYEPGCEPIFGTSKNNKINFLFIPSGYNDYNEFKSDALDLLEGKNSILKEEPFSLRLDRISVSIVNTTQNIGCLTGCQGISAAICCNNEAVLTQASQCNYDSLLVLVNEDDYCGSASSYAKVCAKNEKAPKILMHELGHSFGGLADEYNYDEVYSGYNIGKVDAPNCDASSCEKWAGITSDCFQGCTYSSLYRSVKGNSIMYDLFPEYNLIGKNHIKNIIDTGISKKVEVNFLAPPEKSYVINLKYDRGKFEFENAYLKPIRSEIGRVSSDYTLVLKDFIGKTIFTSNISVPNLILPLPGTNATPILISNFTYPLLVPYFPEAGELEILFSNQVITEIDLKTFSDTCGDSICSEKENNLNCLKDCPIERDGFCQRSQCDPDCPSQSNCQEKESLLEKIQLLLVIMFIVGILGLIVYENIGKKK